MSKTLVEKYPMICYQWMTNKNGVMPTQVLADSPEFYWFKILGEEVKITIETAYYINSNKKKFVKKGEFVLYEETPCQVLQVFMNGVEVNHAPLEIIDQKYISYLILVPSCFGHSFTKWDDYIYHLEINKRRIDYLFHSRIISKQFSNLFLRSDQISLPSTSYTYVL